jgi:hypothetical protein
MARSALAMLGKMRFRQFRRIPTQEDVLPFGVTNNSLAVPPKLRVVRRKQHQSCMHSPAELLNDSLVAKV